MSPNDATSPDSPNGGGPPAGRRVTGRVVGIVLEPTAEHVAAARALAAAGEVGGDVVFPGIVSPCVSTAVTNLGGAVGTADPVELIFWGTAWQTLPDPTNPAVLLSDSVTAAVKSVLAGPWFSALRQYGVRRCPFGSSRTVTSSNPVLLPNQLSEDDVQGVVQSLIDDNTFPEPDEPGGRNLYFVFLPPGAQVGSGAFRGAHGYFNSGSFIDVDHTWYAWVHSNQPPSAMMSTFTHELAEMCTNPEGDAWFIDDVAGACQEIGDICNILDGPLNGVNVESYWSIYDKTCVIPTAWSVKRALAAVGITLGGKGLLSVPNTSPSMNQWIVNL